jgi:hypothetical protein
MIKLLYQEVEAHFTKSIPHKRPPRSWKKGVGAEADAVAGIFSWQLGEYPFCCRIFFAKGYPIGIFLHSFFAFL